MNFNWILKPFQRKFDAKSIINQVSSPEELQKEKEAIKKKGIISKTLNFITISFSYCGKCFRKKYLKFLF